MNIGKKLQEIRIAKMKSELMEKEERVKLLKFEQEWNEKRKNK